MPQLLCQALMQAPPQVIYVHEAAGGMPEWERTIISAGVGAVFAIASSLLMEYMKPWIQRGDVRRRMIRQLNEELLKNMPSIEGSLTMLSLDLPPGRSERAKSEMAGIMLSFVKSDRFDYFFTEEKTLLYEYDQELIILYDTVRKTLPGVLARNDRRDLEMIIKYVVRLARDYMLRHNLELIADQEEEEPGGKDAGHSVSDVKTSESGK
jgi:hypothetical protein